MLSPKLVLLSQISLPGLPGGAGTGLQRPKHASSSQRSATSHGSNSKLKKAPTCPPVSSYVRIITALAGAGVAVDAPDSDGATALHAAARLGLCDIARTLVRTCAPLASVCLCAADVAYLVRTCCMQINLGACINACDVGLCTSLHYACAFGSADVETLLVDAGVDTTALNETEKMAEEVRGLGARIVGAPTEDILWVRAPLKL